MRTNDHNEIKNVTYTGNSSIILLLYLLFLRPLLSYLSASLHLFFSSICYRPPPAPHLSAHSFRVSFHPSSAICLILYLYLPTLLFCSSPSLLIFLIIFLPLLLFFSSFLCLYIPLLYFSFFLFPFS